jgi:putative ATPase
MHNSLKPLAEKMRPKNLDEFVGQKHLLGEGKLLRRLIQAKKVPSCIFYGPPGTGKTTLAQMIADSSNSNFVKLNAISSGVADAKAVIEDAKKAFEMYGKRTYLLLDEIHRWSKSQQDTLLASLESGHICLVGSTTESPYYALNRAIVSRCSVFEFKKIEVVDIKKALLRAVSAEDGLKSYNIKIDDDALVYFATACGGDVRSALNGLEIGAITTPISVSGEIIITKEIAVECLQKKALSLNEDVFYHITSAFCKSLRGSDATAALYYAFRLIEAGAEIPYIIRRCIAHSSEDCSFDSGALTISCNALYAFENLGAAEGTLALTQAIIFICNAKKDNTVVLARAMAIDDVQNHPDDNIPEYLKNHTEASKNYKYPHDFGGYVEQQYLPNSLKDRNYIKKTD